MLPTIPFATLYYLAAALGVLSLPLFAGRPLHRDAALVRALPGALIILVYLLGMLREDGVDIDNYRYAFTSDPQFIPDLGFQGLIVLFNAAGMPFEALMLAIGLVNLYALHRMAKHFEIPFGPLLVLWFLHIAVVRDFAQLRSSLAVSLVVIGLTLKASGPRRWSLYVSAVGMHLTAVFLVLSYVGCLHIANIESERGRITRLAVAMGIIVLVGLALPFLGFIDPRIDIYLNWERQGYGTSVDSFGSLILHLLVLLMALATRSHWRGDKDIRAVFYLQLLGIASFISLSSVAIFAFRLSNIMLSLYPVLVLEALGALRIRWAGRPVQRAATMAGLLMFALALLLRPGNYQILDLVKL